MPSHLPLKKGKTFPCTTKSPSPKDFTSWAVLASSRPPLLIARDKRLVGLGDLNTTGSTKSLEMELVYVPCKVWK